MSHAAEQVCMDPDTLCQIGREVGAFGVAVYCFLAARGEESPSLTTIAQGLRISRATVIRTLRRLEEIGAIARERRTNDLGAIVENGYASPKASVSQILGSQRLVSEGNYPSIPGILAACVSKVSPSGTCPIAEVSPSGIINEPPFPSETQPLPGLAAEPKKRTVERPPKEPSPPNDFGSVQAFKIAARRCCDHYQAQYVAATLGARKPLITERQKESIRGALRAVQEADGGDWLAAETEVKRLIDLLLVDEDSWVCSLGHDLVCLPSRLNALRNGTNGHRRNGNGKPHITAADEYDQVMRELDRREAARDQEFQWQPAA